MGIRLSNGRKRRAITVQANRRPGELTAGSAAPYAHVFMGIRANKSISILTLTLAFSLSLSLLGGCGSDDEEPGGAGGTGAGGTGGAGGGDGGALDCAGVCGLIVPLGCANGPPGQALCDGFCQGTLTGGTDACKAAMQGVLDCVTPSSTVSCDGAGNPTSPDCAAEWQAVVPCLPQL
jgi:hypothetical protein